MSKHSRSLHLPVKETNKLWTAVLFSISLNLTALPLNAQIIPPPPQNPQAPPAEPSPSQPLLNLPPLPQFPAIPPIQGKIKVRKFIFVGNTVFSTRQLEKFTAPFVGRSISFAELQQVVDVINNKYLSAGYIDSGTLIPAVRNQFRQSTQEVVITVRVVEGRVRAIKVSGSDRLRHYVRSRLRLATSPALNYRRLQETLRLLQVNPLIKQISVEVVPGSLPGRASLDVRVVANPTISVQPSLDNDRSPLIGTFERRIQLNDLNLVGAGDSLNLIYANTEGSNAGQASYLIPLNAHNTTLQFDYQIVNSTIVQPPFNQLNIFEADRSYQVSLRQPLLLSATEHSTKEFAIGITGSREESDQRLSGIPFPISPGADNRGQTRISALRFFQEWNQRSDREVLQARSEFSLGTGALNATIHTTAPDSRFFIWRGQAAWLWRLNRRLTLVTRTALQFASRPLAPFEQFVGGGVTTVRGYREDALLTDNGIFGSVELRIPILGQQANQLLLAPFVDGLYGFNVRGLNPDPSTLAGAGLGVEYLFGERLRLRLDYGIPIIAYPNQKRTLQENGLYLNLSYKF